MQNKSYYIPGDAVVYGTMNNNQNAIGKDGNFIKIFGHGTLSGDKVPNPNYTNPPIAENDYWTHSPVNIQSMH